MVEVIPDMPPDTLGFRVSGRLARSDYVDEPVPPLQEGWKPASGYASCMRIWSQPPCGRT